MIEQAPEFYQPYLRLLDLSKEPVTLLHETFEELIVLLEPITEEKSLYRYDEGKWSIRDIAQHLIDA